MVATSVHYNQQEGPQLPQHLYPSFHFCLPPGILRLGRDSSNNSSSLGRTARTVWTVLEVSELPIERYRTLLPPTIPFLELVFERTLRKFCFLRLMADITTDLVFCLFTVKFPVKIYFAVIVNTRMTPQIHLC